MLADAVNEPLVLVEDVTSRLQLQLLKAVVKVVGTSTKGLLVAILMAQGILQEFPALTVVDNDLGSLPLIGMGQRVGRVVGIHSGGSPGHARGWKAVAIHHLLDDGILLMRLEGGGCGW